MTAPKAGDMDALFARRLRSLRMARGISGTALAGLAGMPTQAVYRIESSTWSRAGRVATVGEAAVLARLLGCDLARMVSPEPLLVAGLGDAR